MRQLYTIFYILLIPWLWLRLFVKGRRLKAYQARIGERFGFFPKTNEKTDIWLHAVSLGEVNAAIPLIKSLLVHQKRMLITTMTPTGSARVLDLFQNQVQHVYIPYELPWALSRFFKQYQPLLGIIFETELWPNLLEYAAASHVKLLLLNARLSEKSHRHYRWIRPLIRNILHHFEGIHAQTAPDAQRFVDLGADPARVHVSGNIKFDVILPAFDANIIQALPMRFGHDRLVLLAASTHEGEEAAMLAGFKAFQLHCPEALLMIAPRHPERFTRVFELSSQMGFRAALRSQPEGLNTLTEVLVLDTLGELLSCYALCHYAFVGGSLVDIGGHNVLEPIAVGVPVMIGPYVRNCQSLCARLSEAGALFFVDSAVAFFDHVLFLQKNPDKKQAMLNSATRILQENKGVLARYLNVVEAM